MEDVHNLFYSLKITIDRFYQKNADLDASGMIDMKPVLTSCKKLELYLKGDFKALWQMERDERKSAQEELLSRDLKMEEELEFKTRDIICSIGDEIQSLRRELAIMSRCAKRFSENYRKECLSHEVTRAKIDGATPVESCTVNHVDLLPCRIHQELERQLEGRCSEDS